MLVVAVLAVDEPRQRKNLPSQSARALCLGRPEIREANFPDKQRLSGWLPRPDTFCATPI